MNVRVGFCPWGWTDRSVLWNSLTIRGASTASRSDSYPEANSSLTACKAKSIFSARLYLILCFQMLLRITSREVVWKVWCCQPEASVSFDVTLLSQMTRLSPTLTSGLWHCILHNINGWISVTRFVKVIIFNLYFAGLPLCHDLWAVGSPNFKRYLYCLLTASIRPSSLSTAFIALFHLDNQNNNYHRAEPKIHQAIRFQGTH